MATVVQTPFRVLKNDTATFMARIEDHEGTVITKAATSEITYTVFLVDPDDADNDSAVSGHEDATVVVADCVFDTLQTDDRWTADSTGYNFRHTIDINTNLAFLIRERQYRVVYELIPAAAGSQPVLWTYLGTVV